MSKFYLITFLVLLTSLANAQNDQVHDHGTTQAIEPSIEEAVHQHEGTTPEQPIVPVAEPAMTDHSAMSMGTETAPLGARDPHAYSGGFTRTEGPFTIANTGHSMHGVQDPILSIHVDRFEYDPEADQGDYELQAWRGTSFDRFIIKTEGSLAAKDTYSNQTELLWGHAISPFWDTELGIRADSGSEGKNRQWLAAGLQGMAPYWIKLDVTAYLGTQGQSEITFNSEYELLLTQRLFLQPKVEITVRGKNDPVNSFGSGLANGSFGLRMRYEFSRQFAPYLGIERSKNFGATADLMHLLGESDQETRYFAGVRFWF